MGAAICSQSPQKKVLIGDERGDSRTWLFGFTIIDFPNLSALCPFLIWVMTRDVKQPTKKAPHQSQLDINHVSTGIKPTFTMLRWVQHKRDHLQTHWTNISQSSIYFDLVLGVVPIQLIYTIVRCSLCWCKWCLVLLFMIMLWSCDLSRLHLLCIWLNFTGWTILYWCRCAGCVNVTCHSLKNVHSLFIHAFILVHSVVGSKSTLEFFVFSTPTLHLHVFIPQDLYPSQKPFGTIIILIGARWPER